MVLNNEGSTTDRHKMLLRDTNCLFVVVNQAKVIRDGECSTTVIAETHWKVTSAFQKEVSFQPRAGTGTGALKTQAGMEKT